MIIITLFFSCVLIICTYWNSYSKLLKQLNGPKYHPPQYNVILLAGNSDSLTQDLLVQLKEQLLNNSIDIGMIYDEVQKRLKVAIPKHTNPISNNNSLIPTVGIQPKIYPENSEHVSGLYQGKTVFAVIEKCVGNKCQFVNITFSNEEPPKPLKITEAVAAQQNVTKIKLTQTLPPLKNDAWKKKTQQPKVTVLKNETTTILKYTESFGVFKTILSFFWTFVASLYTEYMLTITALTMPTLSLLINWYRWQTTKQTYEEPRRVGNAPGIREILKKCVKNLQQICSLQEEVHRSEKKNTYYEIVNDMNQHIQQFEDALLQKELKIEEDIMSLITDESTDILQTLHDVNTVEIERRAALTAEKKHLLLLYEKESYLLIECVFKLASADMQFDYIINVLETALSMLDHQEKIKLLKIREKIDALRRDRDQLMNFFEHPSLLKLIIGNRELTDHVPSRFLVSTNQNEASS